MLMDCPRFLIVTQIFGFLNKKEKQVEHVLVLINTPLRLLALSQSSILYWHVDTLQQVCILILAHIVYILKHDSLLLYSICCILKCSGDAGRYA